ncbi:hypothetical protein V494_07337 [Pseudogymnoascus sp. VKM F-4513 (FW-928)]|nr:hypothetical protein V494_07337 [Pseudogymnoascus sp. VKM F-4513 (FW-928)]
MAGSTVPGLHAPGNSPQSSRTSGTAKHTDTREEAKERRKAAAKALAEQSRLKLKSSQKFTSPAKTSKSPEENPESQNVKPARLPHISRSGSITSPVKSTDPGSVSYSTSQLDIFPSVLQGNKLSLPDTDIINRSPLSTHTDPISDNAEPSPASIPATTASPKKLSPNNFAKRDARFEVQFLAMKDETIKTEDRGYMSKPMFLEWEGIDKEALKIIKGGNECLLVEFCTIQRIHYDPTDQHIQLIFNTTTQEETVVIAMKALPGEDWANLQQLFRQVEKKWHIKCDQENKSFFEDAIKTIRKKPYKKMETPYPNRSDAIGQKAAGRLPKEPRRQSVPQVSRRQSVGPTLGNASSEILQTPKHKAERPKLHLSTEVKNIMAAKVIDQPLQIPHLTTPSKPPSVTSSLMSRTSQSPVKERSPVKEKTESQRSISRRYVNEDSPTKRSVGSQNKSQVLQSPAALKRDVSPHGLSSLFGSDDSEHDFSGFEQPDRTPSQRFTDQMNEARRVSSSQLNVSPGIGPILFDRSSDSILCDQSAQKSEKPEPGFGEFMDSVQGSSQIENALTSSFPNIGHKGDGSPLPAKLPKPSNVTPIKLATKRPKSGDGVTGGDRPPKKSKETHGAPENETQFYYQCKSGQDFLLPVAVNDQVIRLRTKKETEESGKQSKYDVFDGPWVVLGISETSFPLSSDFFVVDEEDSDSAVSRQAEWDKMLTTKVRLSFPEGSEAPPWVEISRLLPVIDPNHIVAGTPIPSSLEVTTNSSYLELVDKLCVQPQAPGSHNSFVKKRSSDALDDELYVVEIRKGKFAVFVDIDHKGVSSESYEVAKIRQKRLRLYTKAEANAMEATQYDNDKWVERLLTQHGDIARNKIIIDEYLCSWAGWAVEDQTWVPRGNFGSDALLKLFDEQNDPFRDVPDEIVVPVDELVYSDDLKRARAALRRSKRSSSESYGQSSAESAQNTDKKRGTAKRRKR